MPKGQTASEGPGMYSTVISIGKFVWTIQRNTKISAILYNILLQHIRQNTY